MKTKVLVCGATGKQGGAVAKLLLQHEYGVVAYVRSRDTPRSRTLEDMGAELAVGDLTNINDLDKAISRVDAVFSSSFPSREGGYENEIIQGRNLVDVSKKHGKYLIYSSVAGQREQKVNVQHANSKQVIEDYIAGNDLKYTVIAPSYLMENLLNFDFNQLRNGVYALPLSFERKIDQVTVLDIAGMVLYALEHNEDLFGMRVEVSSDVVSASDVIKELSNVLGRTINYYQIPIDRVRQLAGNEIANMFQRFESNPYHIDIDALKMRYPGVHWHTFGEWVKTIDWEKLLPRRI